MVCIAILWDSLMPTDLFTLYRAILHSHWNFKLFLSNCLFKLNQSLNLRRLEFDKLSNGRIKRNSESTFMKDFFIRQDWNQQYWSASSNLLFIFFLLNIIVLISKFFPKMIILINYLIFLFIFDFNLILGTENIRNMNSID